MQQSGSQHSQTQTSMSIALLSVKNGAFTLQQRGLCVSPLGRGFEIRACSWALTRGHRLPRMSGVELLGSLCTDSLGIV
ncbi:hypothetical protein MRX96_028179 [Rhipicephalus microplus]